MQGFGDNYYLQISTLLPCHTVRAHGKPLEPLQPDNVLKKCLIYTCTDGQHQLPHY